LYGGLDRRHPSHADHFRSPGSLLDPAHDGDPFIGPGILVWHSNRADLLHFLCFLYPHRPDRFPDAAHFGPGAHALGHWAVPCGKYRAVDQIPDPKTTQMDKSKFIAQVLERIQASEGAGFRMDREKILDKYRREPGESGPLAIKVLSVLGGILATVAFGAFLGFLDIFDSNPAMLGLGSILLVGSMALQRIYDSLVLDALGISLYILGMLLIIFGLGEFRLHGNSIALLVLGLALITLLVSRNYLLCFISTLVLAADFLYLILENELPDMIHAYVAFFSLALAHCMLNEAKYLSAPPLISRIYGPLRAGLIFSLLFGLVPIGIVGMAQMDSDRIWISALAPLAIILYQVPSILKILGTAKRDRTDRKSVV